MILGVTFINKGYEEIIIPNVWSYDTFLKKAGDSDIAKQMFNFKDKGERDICLNPEITGIIQELINQNYFQNKYPAKLFYISKCYRYETPQKGRYREFTQLGVEVGVRKPNDALKYKQEVIDILIELLDKQKTNYKYNESVKRGLTYYTSSGFEIECENLGSQKQIAGGGVYNEGVGFAIGLERWLLALERWK